jgi:replicative DNA helicase
MNYNLEEERNILSGCISQSTGYVRIAGIIKSKHFYDANHRMIFESIERVYDQGLSVDFFTVEDDLMKNNNFDKIGGAKGFVEATSTTATSANIESYAVTVKEYAIIRGLLQYAGQVQSMIDNGSNSQDIISNLINMASKAQDVSSGSQVYDMGQLFEISKDSITAEKNAKESGQGIAIGIPGVDNKIGGLRPGNLVMIAARPSMGKSDFALNIARRVAEKGSPVGFISAEMTPAGIMERVLSANLKIDSLKIKNAELDEFETEAIWSNKDIAKLPIYTDFTSSPNVHMIRARFSAMKANYGIKVGIIDHMHEMSWHTNHKNSNLNWREVPKGLRDIARDLEIPIVLLAQLSRETEHNDRRPKLSDIREAGEESADVVIMLWRKHYQADDSVKVDELELLVRKARGGVIGCVKSFYDLTTGFIGELNVPF